jgi:cyclopropane-fatty-acyl-phospholipid synthase
LSGEAVSSSCTWVDRRALALIQAGVASAPLGFKLWDGYELRPRQGQPIATFVIKNRRALFGWAWDPDLYFGEAYMVGAVEVRGDLVAALEAAFRAMSRGGRLSWLRHRPNGLRAARDNVHHHYDLGNDFYRLWLDREMVYTCAYFPTPDATLEEAQLAKMDLVCRKLRLKPGDRVVEAGCGWGSLAMFMAERYGATVRAFNLSTEQIAFARDRAKRRELSHRIEFVDDDYRNMTGRYDVFVSVGMLEHVGKAHYPTLGAVIDRSLDEHGRGLLHFIGRDQPAPLNRWIARRIFPGGYPPTLGEVLDLVLAPQRFSVLDVENLRLHYAKTLAHWLQRFSDAADRARATFDETFVRAWRLYLAGSEASFRTGSMQLFQIVFSRGGNNAIPWTRDSG